MITARELGMPLRSWVPNWLGIALIFIIIIPVLMLNGSYTGSLVQVSNTLGTNTEDITMAFYAAAAGMAVAYPITPKVLAALSAKSMLMIDLVLQFLLSWICAVSDNADILIVCSFAIGFLKEFVILWFIRYAKQIFSPRDIRSEFYSYFYPMIYGGGQLSMYATAILADHYNWRYMYYFMMILILIGVLGIAICLRHNRPTQKIPVSELHIRDMVIIACGLLMLMYVINYGKLLDWMASDKICLYIAISPMLIALFIWHQHKSGKPYVNLFPLFQPKVLIGTVYMFMAMFFSTSTTLLSNYMTSILHVDTTHSYSLYIYLLPGYVVGAFICFWWFRWQRWRFRFLIAGGMGCFALFFGILYFTISPTSTYEMLYFPVFLRGLGMIILIIAFALFGTEDLPPKYLIPNAFFLIIFRSTLAPICATAFYSNILYDVRLKYFNTLVENVTAVDPLAISRYNSALHSAIAGGHSMSEATQLATNTLYNVLQQQSLLLALKDILGWLFIVTLVLAIISRFIPFHKTIRVVFAKTGDDMV